MDSKCKQNYFIKNNCGGIPHYFNYNNYQPKHYFQPYAQQQHYFGLGYDRLNNIMYPNGRFYYNFNNCRNFSTINAHYNNSSPIKMNTTTSTGMPNFNKNKTKVQNYLSTEQINNNYFGERLGIYNQNSSNGFINGIKNIVNGFFNSKSNCDLYYEHHRSCNQKYENNNIKKNTFDSMMKDQNIKSTSKSHIKTITSDINVKNKNNDKIVNNVLSQTQSSQKNFSNNNNNNSTMNKQRLEYNVTAIFSYDDFPELPIPKRSLWSTKSKCINKTLNNPSESLKLSSSSSSSLSFHKNDTQKHENTKQKENLKDYKCTNNSKDSFIIIDKHDKLINEGKKSTTITNLSSSKTSVLPSLSDNNTQKLDIDNIMHQKSCYNRIRQVSECSSDDSFVICFTDDAAEGVIEYDNDEDNDDNNDVVDYDNNECNKDNCNDDDEIYDNECKPNDIENSSKKTDHIKISPDFECFDIQERDSGFEERNDKKVRFNLKPEIHVMHVWDYAYRAARKSNWEDYARDRSRFKHRIDNLEVIINPILNENHRNKIYRERFCDNS